MDGDKFRRRAKAGGGRRARRLFLVPALLACALGISSGATTGAEARAMSAADHEAAMSELTETEAAMAAAEAALDDEATREAAAARRDELAARLDRLRALMVEAAKRDRIGAKGSVVTPERERARAIVAEAGALEDRLQDLWVLWSMRARGETEAAGFTLAPIAR
ncbi:hypothetical protein Plav_1682 [Parvibaculum lavamentivorans DS-1]|uniref:Uncharacterized protein n=1 Tax=Parvibaculum lavamentivorans (strain DS-1 / DSM 13023 / NCIMB 13966) TaxID=402881 RepID=A7HTR8_PARL1|nr:hypothetical protein [Parvibaculum lavamentivorans]ABS63301.1 hypothetical protein Plav_1682 [Parvibaculum lavamentivorans DS-1]